GDGLGRRACKDGDLGRDRRRRGRGSRGGLQRFGRRPVRRDPVRRDLVVRVRRCRLFSRVDGVPRSLVRRRLGARRSGDRGRRGRRRGVRLDGGRGLGCGGALVGRIGRSFGRDDGRGRRRRFRRLDRGGLDDGREGQGNDRRGLWIDIHIGRRVAFG